MKNLTHLLCHPHCLEWGTDDAYITLKDLRAILRSPYLTSLTHLRLRLSSLGDAGAKAIVKSGILKRLKVLDLRHGCIGDEGAKALAGSPDLKHLELLDLSRNQLTEEGIEAMEATGVFVDTDYQHDIFDPEMDAYEDAEWLRDGEFE